MTLAQDLVDRGYFPRELPPPFTTHGFADLVRNQRALLPAPTLWAACAAHNFARPGSLRRPLKIPNPQHHLQLAEAIDQDWANLLAAFRPALISVSAPMLRRTVRDRAVVPRFAPRVHARLRARRLAGGRYFLRADVSQFYPSLYTHVIPWALHTKAVAKAQMRNLALAGNRIDTELRRQQAGQTVGIPIGPDSSLIVAEVVLGAVDAALSTGRRLRGLRNIDDYDLAFDTPLEAEQALADLQGLLAGYELALNPRKTGITEGPVPLEEPWVHELRRFRFGGAHTVDARLEDAIAFFSRAFELAHERPQAGVLRYAAKLAQRWAFQDDGWRTFQGLLFSVAAADPGTLPALTVLLDRHVAGGGRVNQSEARRVLDAIILRHAPLAHGSEVAWSLWAAIQFDVDLTAAAAEAISQMDDDVVALLALHANDRGRFPAGALDPTPWQNAANLPEALSSEHWLLPPAPSVSWRTSCRRTEHPRSWCVGRAGPPTKSRGMQ